jgi:putative ubiquitin-RnfH superfamily antitoxin RatB of RatAB toxin-antitoxin module
MIGSAPAIEVTVVLALPDRATEIAVLLPTGATLDDALKASGLAKRHPDVDMARVRVGIFGKMGIASA